MKISKTFLGINIRLTNGLNFLVTSLFSFWGLFLSFSHHNISVSLLSILGCNSCSPGVLNSRKKYVLTTSIILTFTLTFILTHSHFPSELLILWFTIALWHIFPCVGEDWTKITAEYFYLSFVIWYLWAVINQNSFFFLLFEIYLNRCCS